MEHKEITYLHIGLMFLVIFSSDCSGSLKYALHSFLVLILPMCIHHAGMTASVLVLMLLTVLSSAQGRS